MQQPPKLTLYQQYSKLSEWIYRVTTFICVLCLGVELVSVLIMVLGRYVFNKVPIWCDQLSLMSLVWMVILSITLSLYKENHMKVELIDKVLPPKAVAALKYFSNIVICGFSVLMVYHGAVMFNLTRHAKLSGFRVSQGLLYLPLIICGVLSIYMMVFCVVRRIVEGMK